MAQIKQNQIVQQPQKKVNPYSALPRDLNVPATSLETIVQLSTNSDVVSNISDLIGGDSNSSAVTDTDVILAPPPVPAILSVKSQTINYGPDGKATVDVVIEVQDVPGSAEYDVRVAKSEGSL